jgi:predicted transcriptional regulator
MTTSHPAGSPGGSQELAILRWVAEHGPAGVGAVAEAFAAEQGLARSTVLTVMERLRKKGHLTRRKSGGVFVYRAVLDGRGVMSRAVGQFIERSLRGSLSPIAAYLAERGSVSDDELRELERAVRALKSKKEAR